MKVAIAQLNYHVGNIEGNSRKISDAVGRAKQMGASLVVFSELSVCGYPPLDLLLFPSFVQRCLDAVAEIARECQGISAIVGGPDFNRDSYGKPLRNAAFFLSEGKIKSAHYKALLPDYDIFDEYRWFEPGTYFEPIICEGKRIALPVCEDVWTQGDRSLYPVQPMEKLSALLPEVVINIAASPFAYGHAEERIEMLGRNAHKYKLPVFYVNQLGAQTDLIFDGGSFVTDHTGKVAGQMKFFEEEIRLFDPDELVAGKSQPRVPPLPSRMERIHDALVLGIRDYFEKSGFRKALLGLSGGIDSAVVLYLAVRALGKENVLAVLMPSQFSSVHSVDDSVALAERLGVRYEKVEIKDLYGQLKNTLEPVFNGAPADVTEENLQARIRGVLLMAVSNKQGYILLNTTNKSELAVGYGTLYGDMCGALSVIGDLYKTEVYELAAFINSAEEVIPSRILTKAPSAELRPGQKDTDSLPEYHVLDGILKKYIEAIKSEEEIISEGADRATVKKVLGLVNASEYKRYQAPPVLRVSAKAFGPGRKMPLVAKF